MKLTYYGHACFGVEADGQTILFDPFITGNPLATYIDINSITADYIFISHGHENHIADAISIAKRTGATCVGAAEVAGWLRKQGVEKFIP